MHQYANPNLEANPLEELKLLALSAGAEVCGCVMASRSSPHASTYIGKGKLAQLKQAVIDQRGDLVVFNHALTPIQERNIEREVGCRVLDRTGLILDIFAQRAQSREGKLQVELAQLRHLSTRLVRGWSHLERQKGGIGLRGPGETQLETDRRLIGHRIKHLRGRLERVSAQRALRRKSRRKVPIPTVCLVGYTNAGKSSLFNKLTNSGVLARDLLFATLDPTMRRLEFSNGRETVLSDTVGFIRDLPHSLIQAFHSTLEEVASAHLLLHVVDCSSEDREAQIQQVEGVLQEIGAEQVPCLKVYNKIDLADLKPKMESDAHAKPKQVWVSAQTGQGLTDLVQAVETLVFQDTQMLRISVPPQAGKIRALLFEKAVILREKIDDLGGWVLDVDVEPAQWGRVQQFTEFSQCQVSEIPSQ